MIGAIKMNDNNRFQINDMETADWALNKIAEAENEIEKNKAYADMQRHKIEQWEADVNKEYNNTVEHFKAHLQAYLTNEGVKSKKLINGNIGFRARQPKWEIHDKDGLVKELENTELHDLVRIKKEPALSEMKKQLTIVGDRVVYSKTGEFLEGIEIIEQEPSFNIKIK